MGESSQATYWTAGTTYYIALDAVESDPVLFQDLTFYIDYSDHCPDQDYSIIPGNSWQLHTSNTTQNDLFRIYEFDVETGNTYYFKTGCGDGASATFFTDLKLENGNCNLVLSGNNTTCPNLSYLEWTADTTGTLFLKVTGQLTYGPSGYYFDYGDFTLAYKVVTPGIPNDLSVQNVTVGNGSSECHDAYQTIVVAGGGTTYTVNSGGESTLIAGVKITMLPGTTVYNGGHLRAFITPDGNYCPGPQNPIFSGKPDFSTANPDILTSPFIKVYPNPASNVITIEFDHGIPEDYQIQLFNTSGIRLMTYIITGDQKHDFDLSDIAPGLYFLQVIANETTITKKIIKQ